MATTENANPPVPTDGHADHKCGVRYLLGDGVTQNLLSSQEFFHKAAQQGHQDAADILSLLPLKKPVSSSNWLQRHPTLFVAGALIPVLILIMWLAAPHGQPSSTPTVVLKTSALIPATGGDHGHRR